MVKSGKKRGDRLLLPRSDGTSKFLTLPPMGIPIGRHTPCEETSGETRREAIGRFPIGYREISYRL